MSESNNSDNQLIIDQDSSYSTGVYPSAAILLSSKYSQAQADQKCAAAWSYFKKELVRSDGAVVRTDDNTIVSEGQSYGMMLALQNDDQATFDKIWDWTKTNMQKNNPYGLFSWQTDIAGNALSDEPAPDAEEMIAMALHFASRRWGDKAAPYDYSNQAKTILDNILKHEMTGDLTLIFSPSDKAKFNPSYFMPAFYRLFALYTNDNRWNTVAQKSYDLIYRCFKSSYGNSTNGLVPDFCNYDGSLKTTGDTFHYDAMRTPFYVGLDLVWFGKTETRAKNYIDKFALFFGPDYDSFGDEYKLDGTIIRNLHAASWVGSFAGGIIGSGYDDYKADFFNHLMGLPLPTGQYRYYNICWYNFGLLLSSGNFRIF